MEDPLEGPPSFFRTRLAPGSLGRQVMTWFVLMTVVPLLIIALVSYIQSKNTLTLQTLERLDDASEAAHGYIENWFHYRRLDIASQAEAYRNAWLLEYLIEGQRTSGESIKEYVNSADWQYKLAVTQSHLLTLIRRYKYIKDIFLIDRQGHIFYSTRPKRKDLGVNLFEPPFKSTQFSKAVKSALDNGDFNYSGLERYQPDDNGLTSFLTAPLANERGDVVGVFAMQIQLDRIMNMLDRKSQAGYRHYLVGEDGLLRSNLVDQRTEVLTRKMSSPFTDPKVQQSAQLVSAGEFTAWHYTGAEGTPVFGISRPVEYLGTQWTLVSEIEVSKALAVSNWLGISISIAVLLIAVISIALAYVLTRRLTDPIQRLARQAKHIADGKNQVFPMRDTFIEISALTKAFNYMLQERGQHEQALEASNRNIKNALSKMGIQERRYRSLVSNIPGIVYRCDLDEHWTMRFMSDYAEELTGYPASDFIENKVRSYASIIHPEDAQLVEESVLGGVNGAGTYMIEYRIVDVNEKIRWVFERGTIVRMDRESEGFLDGFIMDISPIKETEMALLEAKKTAESASKAKSDFLAVVSHEIRTPLNGVIGMLGVLEKMDLNTEQFKKTHIAKDSANSLLTLINDILDFSKVDSGKMELENTSFNVVDLMESTLDSIRFKAQENNVDLILNTQDVAHDWICGDPTRIRQIIINLVGNALKFTHEGWIKVTGVLKIDESGGRFICTVADTGIGIEADKLQYLFESFTQADVSTTRKYGGTGLGLAICKRLCHLMGGDIYVTSEVGKGSQFTFHMPLALGSDPQLESNALDNESELLDSNIQADLLDSNIQADLASQRLLVVDDNQINLLVAEDLLDSLGITPVTSCNGLEAIETLIHAPHENPFTIILMDCQMPEMDGYEATEKIRNGDAGERYKGIPIIAVTANAMEGDKEKCVAAGMDDYLSKPIHFDQLQKILSKWCKPI